MAVELGERQQRRVGGDVGLVSLQLLQETFAAPVVEQAQRPRGAPLGRERLEADLPLDHPEAVLRLLDVPETGRGDGVRQSRLDRRCLELERQPRRDVRA